MCMMNSSLVPFFPVSAAIAYIHLREEWKKCNEEQVKNENTLKTAENIKDAIFVSFWQMNVVDIEMTLSHVCQAVSLTMILPSLYLHLDYFPVVTFYDFTSGSQRSWCFQGCYQATCSCAENTRENFPSKFYLFPQSYS